MDELTQEDIFNQMMEEQSKTDTEDSNEQPDVDEDDSTEIGDESPEENSDETEDESNDDDATDDTDEESEDETDEDNNNESDFDENEVFDFGDDLRASAKDIKSWKKGFMLEADYTKGKQALADDRKALEAKDTKLQDNIDVLEVLIAEDILDSEALKELKEYNPEEYIEYTEKLAARQNKLQEIKDARAPTQKYSNEYTNAEYSKLTEYKSEWFNENGQATQAQTDDLKAVNEYLNSTGMSEQDRINLVADTVSLSSWKILLDATENSKKAAKVDAVKKEVRNLPRTSKKPAGNKKSDTDGSNYAKAEKAFDKNPTQENFDKLQEAQFKKSK